MVNWVAVFESRVHAHGDRAAVVFDGERVTYAELNRAAARFGAWLDANDVERLAVFLPNHDAYFVAFLGALKAGAVAVPINYMAGEDIVEHVLTDAGADALVTGADDLAAVGAPADAAGVEHVVTVGDSEHPSLSSLTAGGRPRGRTVHRRDDDPLNVLYTSGTTGMPKGVVRTHRGMGAAIDAVAHAWKITPDQTWLCAGPLYHSAGLDASTLPVLASGATVLLHRWDVDRFLAAVERHQPDVAFIAGSMLIDLLNAEDAEAYDLSSLNYISVGGAPLDPADYDEIEARYDAGVAERLGMTEAGIVLTHPVGDPGAYSPRDETPAPVHGSCGRPLEGSLDVRVADLGTGEAVSVGEGELQVRGDALFREYLGQPDTTAAAFTEDGWYRTGDLVRVDADGYFYHVRRIDDMINTGGENVYPTRIEHVLNRHPDVRESAVFPLPDDRWGERVCAAVVRTPGSDVTEAELLAYAKESGELAAYEVPKQIEFRDDIPRTPTKTVRRAALTDEYR